MNSLTRTTAPWLLAVALTAGCGGEASSESSAPNVVIFLIDTLRADRMGVYGYEHPTTPFLDELARTECVVFEDASSPAPWTLPSVVSMMTSTFLPEHGVSTDSRRLPEGVPTLATHLKRAGYSTGSIYHNPYAGPLSGLERDFDLCIQSTDEVGFNHVRDWLDADPDPPFYLYLHNAVPHDPYDPPERLLSLYGEVSSDRRKEVEDLQRRYRKLTRQNNVRRFDGTKPDNSIEQTELLAEMRALQSEIEALYDGEVHHADEYIRRVVEELKKDGVWDNTLFIVLSDHGEELGEHGGFEHDQSLYEELVRVPFVVHFPRGAHAGTRVEAPVSLVDLLPTVLDAVGLEVPRNSVGHSLLPLLDDPTAPLANQMRVVSYRLNLKKLYTPWKEERGDENVVVREGSWKAIWNVDLDRIELFDLASDPGEENDLAGSEQERAQRMREFARSQRETFLTRALESTPDAADLAPEVRERLQDLGYLSNEE